ncbi:hypothetical protein MKZ38_005802 [Zalerion maritima]|uniref:Ams2/SPT21 N-terminal domain-containing protein n=1 Tax=Zalerion maritima TaxID=339359 RepID=A0AAD5RXU6_9PEZI|nr:hypothetical protein MKZ38_005802 [Zalerion maritima]
MAWPANSASPSHWNGGSQQPTAPQPDNDDGLQARPMGLKVHYTFSQNHALPCLARWKDTLPIQCMPIDHQTTVGVIDLQICLQAITQGSPELMNQSEIDYTIYAVDFSEPETPLVGQGMLSWVMKASGRSDAKQLITGRVTRNKFSVFGNGPKESLEVTLQLKAMPKVHQQQQSPQPQNQYQQQQSMPPYQQHQPRQSLDMPPSSQEPPPMMRQSSFSTPSETNEWNSLMQANSSFGHSRPGPQVQSPSIQPAVPYNQQRLDASDPPPNRPPSIGPPQQQKLQQQRQLQPIAPEPQLPILLPAGERSQSRPSSRNSIRKEPKPRGRPKRKGVATEGNTSGYEDGTEAEDSGQKKKRAKVTRVGRGGNSAFGAKSDSLRGVAIASESLRNIRPSIGAGEQGPVSHLQEVPRVPTPVPMRRVEPRLEPQGGRAPSANNSRRQSSVLAQESRPVIPPPSYMDNAPTPLSQDARSPTESLTQSPEKNYTPADSPADIASSPPVPRSAYTPVPSSPVLPPMPQQDSGFMSGGIEDNIEEPDLPRPIPEESVTTAPPPPPNPAPKKRGGKKASKPAPATMEKGMVMEQPGPVTLLPQTVLYNPPPHIKRRLEAASNSQPTRPPLNKSHTEPIPDQQFQPPHSQANKVANKDDSGNGPQTESKDANDVGPHYSSRTGSAPATIQPSLQAGEMQPPTLSPEMSQPGQTPVFQSVELSFDSIHGDLFGEGLQSVPEAVSMSMDTAVSSSMTSKEPRPSTKSRVTSRKSTRERSAPTPSVLPPIPASDPVLPALTLSLPEAPVLLQCPQTDALQPKPNCPSKNYVKKQSIKDRLNEAVARGELPTFCANCGAIETPTWRKMYYQEHDGQPPFVETSKEPGKVVSVDILDRDAEAKPTKYRMVKKSLAESDERPEWTEMILCNPCGIWIIKYKSQRPPEKWTRDEARLGQERKKRQSTAKDGSRSKKSRSKSESHNFASDAPMPTDPLGPIDLESPGIDDGETQSASGVLENQVLNPGKPNTSHKDPFRSRPGSGHSRASGGLDSPIPVDVDDGLGDTRRLLFPSPRKNGEMKILTDVSINLVHTDRRSPKDLVSKEKIVGTDAEHAVADDMEDLFGPTPARPSTPPPRGHGAAPGPFKTPNRPTPSHRPITRSVSRSIRSSKVMATGMSPHHQGNPPQTPTPTKRRSPRNQDNIHASLHIAAHFEPNVEETPFTRQLNQLLSEAHSFTADSPSQGVHNLDFDLDNLPTLPHGSNAQHGGHHHIGLGMHHGDGNGGMPDFSQYISTDGIMPSSPPLTRHQASLNQIQFGGDLWGSFGMGQPHELDVEGDHEVSKDTDNDVQDDGANES